jgi:hypothetical protein
MSDAQPLKHSDRGSIMFTKEDGDDVVIAGIQMNQVHPLIEIRSLKATVRN